MACKHLAALAPAYVDGELDAERLRWFEGHLAGCMECRQAVEATRAQSAAIRALGTRHRAPPRLAGRVTAVIEAAGGGAGPSSRRRFALAASLAGVAVLSGATTWLATRSAANDALPREIVSSHLRALIGGQPIMVASSDQHVVKPWFAGRVDVAPPTIDLAAGGFDLVGGRVDYIAGRVVPVVVYRLRGHLISVYVWRGADRPEPPLALAEQGFALRTWSDAGLRFWAISDAGATDLDRFVALLREALRA